MSPNLFSSKTALSFTPKMAVLSQEQVEQLHSATLELLERTTSMASASGFPRGSSNRPFARRRRV